MTFDEIQKFFAENISYKEGWRFVIGRKDSAIYLQIQFDAPDNFTGQVECQHCRKWWLSEWMTPTELVQTAWAAVERAELHEARERFKYKGLDVFNNHLSVEGLAFLCENGNYEHRAAPVKELNPYEELVKRVESLKELAKGLNMTVITGFQVNSAPKFEYMRPLHTRTEHVNTEQPAKPERKCPDCGKSSSDCECCPF